MNGAKIVRATPGGRFFIKSEFNFNVRHAWTQQLFVAEQVINQIEEKSWKKALERHLESDWGECSEEQWCQNDMILELDEEFPVCSIYRDRHGREFCIETNGERNETFIRLPETCWVVYDLEFPL